jgi:hypothetical protein
MTLQFSVEELVALELGCRRLLDHLPPETRSYKYLKQAQNRINFYFEQINSDANKGEKNEKTT